MYRYTKHPIWPATEAKGYTTWDHIILCCCWPFWTIHLCCILVKFRCQCLYVFHLDVIAWHCFLTVCSLWKYHMVCCCCCDILYHMFYLIAVYTCIITLLEGAHRNKKKGFTSYLSYTHMRYDKFNMGQKKKWCQVPNRKYSSCSSKGKFPDCYIFLTGYILNYNWTYLKQMVYCRRPPDLSSCVLFHGVWCEDWSVICRSNTVYNLLFKST